MSEREDPEREFVHFAMNELVTRDVDMVVAWMWRDPDIRRVIDKPRRPDAIRLAIGQFISRLPAEVRDELLREVSAQEPKLLESTD
jgi:hypothetical protein